jgi:hypothetical protein
VSIGPADFGYELLAPDPGIVSPDLALDAALAPSVDFAQDEPQPLGQGWAFDFEANQFVKNGISPQQVFDVDNLRYWIEKALRTARYAYPIYSDSYGIVEPYAPIGFPVGPTTYGDYQQMVIDALTVHDRIAAVSDFSFSRLPSDDALYASFTVILDDASGTLSQSTLEFTALPLGGW